MVHLEQGDDKSAQGIKAGTATDCLDEDAPAVHHDPRGHYGLPQLHRRVLGQPLRSRFVLTQEHPAPAVTNVLS